MGAAHTVEHGENLRESKMKEEESKVVIVIPARNESKTIVGVIKKLKELNYNNIIVVNDGSTDNTSELAKNEVGKVYNHIINRGLGGALGTGIKMALIDEADIIVTFDADGQHNPKDIERLIDPIECGEVDVVIGSRVLNNKKMPFDKRIANKVGNFLTKLLFGIYVTDSQSGLRAFSKYAAQKIKIKTNEMEVSSEIISEIKRNKLRLKEIPIEVIYTDYSINKGQKWYNGFRILKKLVYKKITGGEK